MALIVRKKLHVARLAEGWHTAEVVEVSAEYGATTQFGVKDRAIIVFNVGGIELRRKCNLTLSHKSTLFGIISELTGAKPGQEVDLEDLVGLKCKVLISHQTMDSGDVWENIEKLRKLSIATVPVAEMIEAEAEPGEGLTDDDIPF